MHFLMHLKCCRMKSEMGRREKQGGNAVSPHRLFNRSSWSAQGRCWAIAAACVCCQRFPSPVCLFPHTSEARSVATLTSGFDTLIPTGSEGVLVRGRRSFFTLLHASNFSLT